MVLGLVGGARVTARPGVRVGVGVGAICYVTLNVIVVCVTVSLLTWSVVSFFKFFLAIQIQILNSKLIVFLMYVLVRNRGLSSLACM